MRVVELCLVGLLVGTTLPAQRELRDVQRAFRGADDAEELFDERLAALAALPAVDRPRVVDVLIDAWVRVHAELRAVERQRGRPAEQLLPSITEMRERLAINSGLRLHVALEERLKAAAGGARAHAVARTFDGGLPAGLRCVLADLGGPDVRSVFDAARAALVAATRPDDAWCALHVLGRLRNNAVDASPDVVAALADSALLVRVEAARTLAAIGARASAPALIDALAREEGRAQRAVATALEQLSGQPLGTAVASWRAWWDAEGEEFVAGRGPKKAAAPRPKAERNATRGAYYGIPQDGGAILYLVDFSKSMQARTGGKDGPTRWDDCVRELVQAIGQLGDDRTFNIVVFAQRVVAWNDRLVPADRRNVAAAETWIRGLELELGTAVFEAFEVAYRYAGPNLEDRYFDPAVDTIFFLSDGMPTARDPANPRQLGADDPALTLALARRRDPFGSIVVNAVMLGKSGGQPFMRALAKGHGGVFAAR